MQLTVISSAMRNSLRKSNYKIQEYKIISKRFISSEKSSLKKPVEKSVLEKIPFTVSLKSIGRHIPFIKRAFISSSDIFVNLVTHERKQMKNYVDYLHNFDKILQNKLPQAVEAYRFLFSGGKLFMNDLKKFRHVLSIVHNSPNGVYALDRKQLELYMKVPSAMYKLTPMFFGVAIPILGTIFLPYFFKYPSKFMTPHFWTREQRAEFEKIALQDRLHCNKELLMQLRSKLPLAKNHDQCEQLKLILSLLASGLHVNAESILAVKEIFLEQPYKLSSLNYKHLKLLMKLHGLEGLLKKRCLEDHAFLLHTIDLAILQEGDLRNMEHADLQYACYMRGLNPIDLSNKDMIEWLGRWMEISRTLKEDHVTFYLHLPLLLGYNHPNNWRLLNWNRNKKQLKISQ